MKLNKARSDHEHVDREAVLPGALKGHVYRPQGWLSPVVLVDGRMERVWRHECRGDRLFVGIDPSRVSLTGSGAPPGRRPNGWPASSAAS